MFKQEEILITKRLTLRPTCEVDLDDITHFLNDYDILKMTANLPNPFKKSDATDFIKRLKTNNGFLFSIIRERLIGTISINMADDKPVLGYWLAKPYWGKGYMSEALEAMLNYAFETHLLNEIHADVFKDNPASLNLLQKFGFEVMGTSETFSKARCENIPEYLTQLKRNPKSQPKEDTYALNS
jgi:RimJ/RimL family protein N-acetyltransferase